MATPYYRGHISNQSNMHSRSSGSSNNFNAGGGRGSNSALEKETALSLMEMENNQRWAELGEQVSLLKELSIDINEEVKSQNKMLDSMGKTFVGASDLFKSTLGKLGTMLSSGSSNGRHMYYLVGFVILVFILLYFLMRSNRS